VVAQTILVVVAAVAPQNLIKRRTESGLVGGIDPVLQG
jgi:hypothetical protein